MTLAITPVDRYTTAQLSAPEDGDDLDAAQIAADLQLIADRQSLARGTLATYLAWSGDFSVEPGGSLTSFTINLGAIALLYRACPDGAYRGGAAAASPITQTLIEGGGGTLGASARWWYVYAYLDNAGSVQAEISLTAPNGARTAKLGDLTRAYLGCFPTDSAGSPIPVRAARGRYVYRRSACASNETRVLNTSAAAGATNLSLAALVPPHARLATLSLIVTGGDGFCGLKIYTDGDTSDATLQARAEAGITTSPVVGDVEASSAQVVDRVVTFGGTTGTAVAHVHGFYE